MNKIVLVLLSSLLLSSAFAQDISNPQTNQSALITNKGQLPATATNDNACVGCAGEYTDSPVASPGVSLSNGVAANVTSISLTAGDWNVTINGAFLLGGATSLSQTIVGISSTSATLDLTPGKFFVQNYAPTVFGANNQSAVVQTYRLSLASTTTIYFVARSAFTLSTVSVWGLISARRPR